MGKYANFYDGVRKLLDKIADALDPTGADVKTANYQTAVLDSLSRIGDGVGDVVSATLPDPSEATDGDTLIVDDGEWVIGSGGGGGGGGANLLIATLDLGTGALDKTWNEINNADYCVAMTTGDGKTFMPIYEIYEDGGAYFVSFTPLGSTSVTFEASSADGYPVMSQ